jgi:hypothetical protein
MGRHPQAAYRGGVSGWSEGPEFLGAGPDPVRSRAGSRVAAVAALAVLAAVGWGAHQLTAGGDTPPSPRVALRAGLLTETGDDDPAAMVVPLSNESAETVTVDDLRPVGWRAYGEEVVVPPHSRVDVEISLSLQCGRMPAPTDRVSVHAVAPSGVLPQDTLRMPGVPSALRALRSRLCTLPAGRDLSRRQLLGRWRVEDGRGYGGATVRFLPDGGFVLGTRAGVAAVTGRFSWQGRWVRIAVRGGDLCVTGDSILWQVGLLPGGRLRIGHVAYYDDRCQVDEREVWVARRL